MKELSLFFIASLFLISCDNTAKVEERITKNDTCIFKAYYINNIPQGPCIQYYLDGKPETMLTYVNGKLEGIGLSYFKNGKLKLINSYLHGKFNGYTYSFDENGIIRTKRLWLNNINTGHDYYFTSKGKPYLYEFKGYSSNALTFKQVIDTITGKQKIDGDILVDSLVLIDSINNKTKLMVIQPFGVKPRVEMRQMKENSDCIILFKVNENDEYVFSNNILHLKGLSPLVIVEYNNGSKKINDHLYINRENCIEAIYYVPYIFR